MHNLNKVIKFEIFKQLRKPLFWIAIFAFPIIMLIMIGVSYMGSKLAVEQSETAQTELSENIDQILLVDHTSLVKEELFGDTKIKTLSDDEVAIEEFKASNNKTALIIYPADLQNDSVSTYTKLTEDERTSQQNSIGISSIAKTVLNLSVASQVNGNLNAALTSKDLKINSQIIDQNGEIYNPLQKMIVPGIFLAVFFLIFMLTGNQTLVATTEEKENRVAEMILTTVNAKTLISGKIIALVALGFIQISALILPILLIYSLGVKLAIVPDFLTNVLTNLQFEFWPTFFGAGLLILGFLMMTGFTILVGSLFPTAQDASQFFAPIVLFFISPIYLMSAIIMGVNNLMIHILSYFPLSAPTTLLIRNMAGNLSLSERLIGMSIVLITCVVIMLLAVRAFKHGVFSYGKPTSLKEIFKNVR